VPAAAGRGVVRTRQAAERRRRIALELKRRYAERLMFRADPIFHPEKFLVTDAKTGAELNRYPSGSIDCARSS
jgi:hypothetical protein